MILQPLELTTGSTMNVIQNIIQGGAELASYGLTLWIQNTFYDILALRQWALQIYIMVVYGMILAGQNLLQPVGRNRGMFLFWKEMLQLYYPILNYRNNNVTPHKMQHLNFLSSFGNSNYLSVFCFAGQVFSNQFTIFFSHKALTQCKENQGYACEKQKLVYGLVMPIEFLVLSIQLPHPKT